VTNHVPTLVFALAGAVVIPTVDRGGTEVALIRMLNANLDHGSAPLIALPGVLECLDLLRVPEVTDKANSVFLNPATVPEGTVRYKFSHNGRNLRIGAEMRTDMDPTWTILTADDEEAAAYISLATIGFRRFGHWNMPPRLLDADPPPEAIHTQRGSPPDLSRRQKGTAACDSYTQGPSNANSCVTCGLPSTEHDATDEGTAQRLRNSKNGRGAVNGARRRYEPRPGVSSERKH
jgi:hypothetical protein